MEILVVDSNRYEAELTSRVLGRYVRNPIRVVQDGREAMALVFGIGERLGRSPRIPQLILIDTHLQITDVSELVRTFQTDPRTAHVPVILMASSQAECEARADSQEPGCTMIVKPLDLTKLAEALHNAEMHWALLRVEVIPQRTIPFRVTV
ncbi:MAG: hypothetical protein HUU17_10290 [Chthonomonadales bacterium]|nr:hypothetical protein [Chthonomonadales bacterium]